MKAEPNRRLVLKGLSVGSAVLFVLKSAQTRPASKIWRIGVLSLTKRDSFTDAFLKALADLGYIEGKSYVLEPRFEAGNEGRLLIFAKQLADAQVDIILARGTQATQLAKRVTKTIPIVMTGSSDPVGSGLVASLARPGGNVTGMSIVATDLTEKRLQLIRRLVPRASRIGVLWNPSNSGNVKEFDRLKSAAERFGVRALSAEVRQAADIGPAINSLVASGADVIMTLADSILVGERNEIVKRASEAKLPGIFHLRDFVEAGGLLSYGPDLHESFRRAAWYVDQIIKGKKPADLPVQEAVSIELAVNLGVAKLLGLRIPQDILVQASKVIE